MPNVTQTQVLDAIAEIIEGVSDVGIVLKEEKFVESESEFISLFKTQTSVKGWLINYSGFPEQIRDSTCDIARTLKYSLEFLYPYDAKKDDDDKNSKTRFIEAVEAVNDALNTQSNWYLGLGAKVEHQLLKTVEDFVVRRWEIGAGAVLTHYGVFELQVSVLNRY